MNEKLLQFIWKMQYFNTKSITTVAGELITIIHKGTYNTNQGPDFINAQIKIGNTTLVGNIELHVLATDWDAHKHSTDANYQNIILHVVWQHNYNGVVIHNYPVLELAPYVAKSMLEQYSMLQLKPKYIPCEQQINKVPALQLNNWKERLVLERLERKTNEILLHISANTLDWETILWHKLAANFGTKVNSEAFAAMASTIPIAILAKNKPSQLTIESLLLGQAGMLNDAYTDAYALLLQKEHTYLANKYKLTQSAIPVQYLRMRPYTFPGIRLSQLASLIHQSTKLFRFIIECESYKQLLQLLHVKANDYWHYHYTLHDDAGTYKEKYIGIDMQHNIIINTVIPCVFAYGTFTQNQHLKDKALLWLEQIPTEVNSIVKGFKNLYVSSRTAADSQALIELKNTYCTTKRCMECTVGAYILKS